MLRSLIPFKISKKKTLSVSEESRQVFLEHIDPICFLLLVTLLHASLKLNIYLYLRIGICVWVILLSPVVMSVVQAFHLYDVEFGLCRCVIVWSSIHRDMS
jgi:hypothetical protein